MKRNERIRQIFAHKKMPCLISLCYTIARRVRPEFDRAMNFQPTFRSLLIHDVWIIRQRFYCAKKERRSDIEGNLSNLSQSNESPGSIDEKYWTKISYMAFASAYFAQTIYLLMLIFSYRSNSSYDVRAHRLHGQGLFDGESWKLGQVLEYGWYNVEPTCCYRLTEAYA